MNTAIVANHQSLNVLTKKSYGAFELKEFIKKSTWRAYLITMILLVLLMLINFSLNIFTSHVKLTAPLRMDRKDIAVDLAPPPTDNLDQPPPPPPPDVVYSGPAARAGVPVPVPDAEIAPDVKDFANTDEIARASSEGGSGDDFGGFASNIKSDEPIKVQKEAEPDPDDFIPVEKEPYVDLGALQRKVQYPEMAKRAGIEGRVTIRILVGKDGKPKKYRIEDSDNDILNKAAADAAMSSTFTPGIQNNSPVECWISIPITFKLK